MTLRVPWSIEKIVRSMTKKERRAHLRNRGWKRDGDDSMWFSPDVAVRSHSYSLAAAIRIQLLEEEPS